MSAFSSSARRPWHGLLVVLLSICFLPIDTYILVCTYVLQILQVSRTRQEHLKTRAKTATRTHVVLITGASTLKGLSLARALHSAGHHMIGADINDTGIPSYCRLSTVLKRYYSLPVPNLSPVAYARDVERIVKTHEVDLWIPCSDIPDPVEDSRVAEIIRRRTPCVVLAFDTVTTTMLQDPARLTEHAHSIGLPVLETKSVSSRDSIHRILAGAQKQDKRYTMVTSKLDRTTVMKEKPLPRRSLSQTYAHISQIDVSSTKPWILREFVEGELYHTHSLVVCGEVAAFIAWRRHDNSCVFEALCEASALNRAMLAFTIEFVSKSDGMRHGQLGFTFIVCEKSTAEGCKQSLFLYSCSTVPHEVSALLEQQVRQSARLYLRPVEPSQPDCARQRQVVTLLRPAHLAQHWIGDDFISLILAPMLESFRHLRGFRRIAGSTTELMRRILYCRNLAYAVQDPLPWWYLYHIEIPLKVLLSLLYNKVGTDKKPVVLKKILD